MELALSLGDPSKPFSSFLDKVVVVPQKISNDGAFCCNMPTPASDDHPTTLPLQLHLLPPSPPPRTTLPRTLSIDDQPEARRGLDVNRTPWETMAAADHDEEAAAASPNSGMSCFQLEFGVRSSKRDQSEEERDRAGSRTSDDEENGSTRKKLRLSKDQSAFLEESFKEHSTLNPKLALAKQLNLRPRQVEVWFQNRRARTKLKQTEVDCEYLKRCCETLTEENRRLQKEVQELRALKSSHPFYMQLPATTLTMCPSCERVATTTSSATATATNTAKLFPYSPPHGQTHQPA